MNTKVFYPNDLVLRANPDGKLNIWDGDTRNDIVASAVSLAYKTNSDIESAKHLISGARVCLDNEDIDNACFLLTKASRFVEDLSKRRLTIRYRQMLYDIAAMRDSISRQYGGPIGHIILAHEIIDDICRRRAETQRPKRSLTHKASVVKTTRRS